MTESNIPSQLFYAYKSAAVFTAAQTVEKHLVCLKMGSQGLPPPTGSRGGSPSKIPLSGERGQFGMDAEIRTHQALHEAKPSECPKGDRDSELEICFKKRLFLQSEPQFSLRLKLLLYILCYLVAHLRAGQLCHTLAHDVACAETVLQHLAYCIFNCVCFLYHIKAVTEHHCG